MTGKRKIGMSIAAILAAFAIGGALFIESGYYDIGADVKHGIKMSAMPAWGRTLDDAAIWDIVAFVRKMPAMTPEIYRELSRPHSE